MPKFDRAAFQETCLPWGRNGPSGAKSIILDSDIKYEPVSFTAERSVRHADSTHATYPAKRKTPPQRSDQEIIAMLNAEEKARKAARSSSPFDQAIDTQEDQSLFRRL